MCAKSKEDKEAKKAAAAAAKAEKAAAKAKGKAKPKKKQNAGVNEYNFFVLHGEWLLAKPFDEFVLGRGQEVL